MSGILSLPPVRDARPIGRIDEVLAVLLIMASHARIRRHRSKRAWAATVGLLRTHGPHVVAAAPVTVLTLHAGERGRALEIQKSVAGSVADGMTSQAIGIVLGALAYKRFVGVRVRRGEVDPVRARMTARTGLLADIGVGRGLL